MDIIPNDIARQICQEIYEETCRRWWSLTALSVLPNPVS